eukprot:gene15192-15339_t
MDEIEDTGAEVLGAGMLDSNPDVLELEIEQGDSAAVRRVLDAHFGDADMLLAALIGADAVSLATGDGANDIPMLCAATHGIAYRAKPKARAAADGRIDRGDLTAILDLYGISRDHWVTH